MRLWPCGGGLLQNVDYEVDQARTSARWWRDGVDVSLYKRCRPRVVSTNEDGNPNPFHCPTSPRCEHYWWATFTVNRHRYRVTTETSDKRVATNIEASERRRILEGRHGIRRLPDLTFREFASVYLRDHAQVNNRRPRSASSDWKSRTGGHASSRPSNRRHFWLRPLGRRGRLSRWR